MEASVAQDTAVAGEQPVQVPANTLAQPGPGAVASQEQSPTPIVSDEPIDTREPVLAQTTLHLTTGEALKTEMFREDVIKAVQDAESGFVELANDVHVALRHIVHF